MIGMNNDTLSSVSSMNFDYRSAQMQLKAALAGQKRSEGTSKAEGTTSNAATIKTLKKDSAAFLDKYTADMEGLKASSDKLSSGGAAKILSGEAGSDSAKNVENVVNAAQEMVDAYNKARNTVVDNASRGSATNRMAERMEKRAIASDRSFELVGITRKEDGSLSLDKKQLTEALTGENKNLTTDVLSNVSRGAKRVATDALIQSPQSLINYDLSEMKQLEQSPSAKNQQQQISTKTYDAMSLYSRSGAYNMMNMGTIGFLMNTFA